MKVNQNFIVLDIESGGFDPRTNLLTQIGFIVLDGFSLEEKYRYKNYIYAYSESHFITKGASDLTGITMDKLKQEGKPLKVVLDEICNIFKGFKVSYYLPVFVGHNFSFDQMFLEYVFDFVYGANAGKNGCCKLYDYVLKSSIDTMTLARQKFTNDEVANFKLGTIGEYLGINNLSCHDALADVEQTCEIFKFMINLLRNESKNVIQIQKKEMNFQF